MEIQKKIIKILLYAAAFYLIPGLAYAGVTNITTCQNLNKAGETYVLQNDVSGDGTCFFVSNNDITLDLNGHVVTYDNAAPINVANNSFEVSDLSDWDLNSAPNAQRSIGTYLGRTVYDGSAALKVTMPIAQDQVIQTADQYALNANVAYSASVMVWQPYDTANATNSDIHVFVELIDASNETVLTSKDLRDVQLRYTTRGFQYVRATYTPSANVNVKLRLRITGGGNVVNVGQIPYGAIYLDDVRIQQTESYGIQFGGTSRQYGVTTSAWARRGKAISSAYAKGVIVQGLSRGDFSHAVVFKNTVPSDLGSYKVDNLEITVSGNSTQAIRAQNAANGTISNNLIHSNVDTIELRDHYDGALIKIDRADPATGVAGKIFNNIITEGIQTGIYVAGSPSPSMLTEIYGNRITLQSKYTNDFAIVGGYGTYAAHIHNNEINCASGNNTCRGIFIHGSNGIIEDNNVQVHYRKNNQEYGLESGLLGCGGAAYGIQVDIASSNVETRRNDVTAYADECEGAAFRFYAQPAGTTLYNNVTNNVFKAISLIGSDKISSVLRILQSYPSDMNFSNNTLITNSSFLFLDGNVSEDANRGTLIDRNAFQIEYPKSQIYYPLIDSAYVNGLMYVPKNVVIRDNIYADDTVRNDMTSAVFRNIRNGFNPDNFATEVLITEFADIVAPAAPTGVNIQ